MRNNNNSLCIFDISVNRLKMGMRGITMIPAVLLIFPLIVYRGSVRNHNDSQMYFDISVNRRIVDMYGITLIPSVFLIFPLIVV